jgi:Protein of unknown function (DUF559)
MQTDGWDEAIGRLATAQQGRVSREQLLGLGLGRGAIEHRLLTGRLRPVHRGVYAVGHEAPSREADWMAAVLAVGEGAALSHWSAAHLWRLRPGRGPVSHVTCPRRRRSPSGIRVHFAVLPADEVTIEDGIPVTTASRVALDLAPLLPSASLTRAIAEAERRRLSHGPSLPELLDRYPRRAGTPKLRAILGKPIPFTRSDLEARFVELVDHAGLPRPETNGLVELPGRRSEADFVWRAQRLMVELDHYATHGDSFAFATDRARDRAAQLAGWAVVRVTDTQLEAEPERIAADLSRLLGASAARPPSHRAAA